MENSLPTGQPPPPRWKGGVPLQPADPLQACHFGQLPDEVILHIFAHVGLPDRVRLSAVCRNFAHNARLRQAGRLSLVMPGGFVDYPRVYALGNPPSAHVLAAWGPAVRVVAVACQWLLHAGGLGPDPDQAGWLAVLEHVLQAAVGADDVVTLGHGEGDLPGQFVALLHLAGRVLGARVARLRHDGNHAVPRDHSCQNVATLLGHFTQLRALALHNCHMPATLPAPNPMLTALTLSHVHWGADYSLAALLQGYPRLQALHITPMAPAIPGLTHVRYVAGLTDLQCLVLQGGLMVVPPALDVAALAACVRLTRLEITAHCNGSAITGLPFLPELVVVDLASQLLAPLAVLAPCTRLAKVRLDCNMAQQSCPGLGSRRITELALVNRGTTTMPLPQVCVEANAPGLVELYLWQTELPSREALAQMRCLRKLTLSDMATMQGQALDLGQHPCLVECTITRCPITTLTVPLSLQTLTVGDCMQLSTLAPLAGCKVTRLILSGCPLVADLGPLLHMHCLQHLHMLRLHAVPSLLALAAHQTLSTVAVADMPTLDLSPLAACQPLRELDYIPEEGAAMNPHVQFVKHVLKAKLQAYQDAGLTLPLG